MKKKLLSLVLAGAMVASTSVSAFAANVTTPDNQDGSAEIKITGEVISNSGDRPSSNFNVTVPTTASFTVDKTGKFIAPQALTIQNEGSQNIDVYAYKFTDTTPKEGEGITVISKKRLSDVDRTRVSLSVTGNEGTVHLASNAGSKNNGIYSDEDLGTEVDELKIASIARESNKDLTVSGEAGQGGGDVLKAVSNSFTLTLKIKKSATQ